MTQNSSTLKTDYRSQFQLVANNIILHLHPARVPRPALRFSYTWGLGGISATLVLLLVITGVLLMFRYEASVNGAYTSIQTLESSVPFGSLFRALHHWTANLLIIIVFLHLVRVFLTGGFKQGRTANWLIGMMLLLLVVAANFTGYLLPWDQLAYWAITVSTSLIGYLPLVGTEISRFILAGPEIGQAALSNFYAVHVAVLPMLLGLTMSYHFWKVRKNGGISQPPVTDGTRVERLATIPHLVRREMAVALVAVSTIMIWSMLVPAPLQGLANPAYSPNPAKAAWYFMGLQELLLHMDALAAITLVGIVLAGLALLPRWDQRADDLGRYFRSTAGQRAALLGVVLSIDLVPLLVIVDEYWLDLPALFPAWPTPISLGLLPLLLTLIGLAAIYFFTRRLFKANHSEALVGLFTFIVISLVILTIIGVFFRGPNMALVLPF